MGKKGKQNAEDNLSGYHINMFEDKSCRDVGTDEKPRLDKSVDCKRAKKRKKRKHKSVDNSRSVSVDLVRETKYSTDVQKDRLHCAYDTMTRQEESFQNDCVNYVQTYTSTAGVKKHRKRGRTDISSVLVDAQRCTSTEMSTIVKKKNKRIKGSHKSNKKMCDVRVLNSNDGAIINGHSARDASWSPTEHPDDNAAARTINSKLLDLNESSKSLLASSYSGSAELLEKTTCSRKKKKRNKSRDRCVVSEKHDCNSLAAAEDYAKILDGNSSVGNHMQSGTLLNATSPVDLRAVHSNQQNTSVCELGQWTGVHFDEPTRQNKFVRLLGGMKKSALSSSLNNSKHLSKSVEEIPRNKVAMTTVEQERVSSVLEQQFQKARDQSFRKQKGAGLGFERLIDSGKTLRIDIGKVRSKRLDEHD